MVYKIITVKYDETGMLEEMLNKMEMDGSLLILILFSGQARHY